MAADPEARIGAALPRLEDRRLLTGRGRFSDDVNVAGQLYGCVARSPHAHARIVSMDVAAAAAAPGVHAVLTAADLNEDGIGGIRHAPNPADAVDHTAKAFQNRDGSAVFDAPQPVLAGDTVRHVGEAVALVVAETPDQARDAAELIGIDYDVLPAVTGAVAAIRDGAPELWPGAAHNICLDAELGDEAATEAAFAAAAHVIERRFVNNRIVNAQMEPRAAIGEYDAESGIHTLHAGSQGVMRQRAALAGALGVEPAKVRVTSGDVGGGFGPRTMLYPEFVLVAWAAKRLGRAVKWSGDRSEAFLGDFQGRDLVTDAALALDRDGRFLAMRVRLLGNVGAHAVSYVPLSNGSRLVSTVYRIAAAHVHIRGALTNTVPTCPFRGAGRPEAVFAIERLIELASIETGIDAIELRRRNLIPRDAMPYRSPVGLRYDCGAFEAVMDEALALADRDGFAARRRATEALGRRRGFGLANYIESPVGAPIERVELSIEPKTRRVRMVVGTQSSGQGHETSFAQVLGETLGVPLECIDILTGDTDVVRVGGGTHSDRSMRIAGTLMVRAGEDIIAQARRIAANLLEAAEADMVFDDGRLTVAGTDRSLELFEVAAAGGDGTLAAASDLSGRIPAYPNGCAVCEVEIDPETGTVVIDRYATVDDAGRVINPAILEGQVHGGIAQGAGQALMENCVYDSVSGQMLSASFMDYAAPRADTLPALRVASHEDLTPGNPLGIKGGGEGGITPALGAVINAVVDALSVYGIDHVEMPATPERIWRLIQASGKTLRHSTIHK